ncbi:MAG: P1 family peptidase [Eubacteriaceae bacterium]|nr:P1 family peptidase [Eubacteriaceae bacterium]
MKEISITEIEGIKIGNAEDTEAGTGCTAVICEQGACPGADIRGGAPASRETASLEPTKMCQAVHCVMLSGGSAFGLASCDGAMAFLEEKGIGFSTPGGVVPIVCGSCIYDLSCGRPDIRPDKEMGRLACENAWNGAALLQGNAGAGTGATVGKFDFGKWKMKGGLGLYAVRAGGVSIGAVAVVNSFGDIRDYDTGKIIAGARSDEKAEFINTQNAMYGILEQEFEPYSIENTCITCIVTDADITKTEANRTAQLAHNGYARTISPVHTAADGDAIFVMATGKVKVNADALGALAGEVTGRAINNAVRNACSAYGIKSLNDL